MSFAPQIDSAPEFHDPERTALIAELYGNISMGNGAMEGTPETQAFLWIADIESLRALAEGSAANRKEARSAKSMLGGGLQLARVADTWLTNTRESRAKKAKMDRKRDAGEMTEEQEDNDAPCSAGMKKKARARDNERCIVTKAEGPLEIAHIYPFCLNGRTHLDSQVRFWNILEYFWSEAKIASWREAILGEEGTEHPKNMLSLTPNVHKYWGKALFALKPLEQSDDGKSLTAEFHWLKQRTGEKSVTLTDMPILKTANDCPGCCIKLWNNHTEEKIVTGYKVMFETDDPVERPLPSWELLDMQWHLQRIAAMAGAGEQDNEDDDDNDIGAPDQAEVGELSDADYSDSDNDEVGDDHASALHGTDVILSAPQCPIAPPQPQLPPPSSPSARRQSLPSSTRRASLSPSHSRRNPLPSPRLMDWTSNLPSHPAPFHPHAHSPALQPDPLTAPQENLPPTPRQTRQHDSNKEGSPTREEARLRRPLH